jgi:hypothetical protein
VEGVNVHDNGGQYCEAQRNVTACEYERAAYDLGSSHEPHVVRLNQCSDELTCQSWRQRSFNEVKEAVQTEDYEDQTHDDARDQSGDFHSIVLGGNCLFTGCFDDSR